VKKIKSLAAFILAAMFALISSCAQTHYNPASPILERENLEGLMNSVVIIDTGDGTCSGVFIDDRQILTAGHCVQLRTTILFMGTPISIASSESPIGREMNVITYDWYLEDRDLSSLVPTPYRVISFSADADLALLECGEDTCLGSDFVINMSLTPQDEVGDVSIVLGHPAGLYYNITTGIFSRDVEIEEGISYIYSSTPIWFGNSGGPIVDRRGNLVGIASAMAGSGGIPVSHLGQFIHIDTIREFLAGRVDFDDNATVEEMLDD
jgi:S1-C subfamily serine protease